MRVAIKSTEGAGASVSVKGLWRGRVCVPLMFAAVLAAGSVKAATYYWKPGSTQGLWTTIENWSTESATGETASALPGSGDKFDAKCDYNIDLCGETHQLSGMPENNHYDDHVFTISNGILKFSGDARRHTGEVNINSGATLWMLSGSTLYTGVYANKQMQVNVNDGGILKVEGMLRLYYAAYNVQSGGSFILSPTSIKNSANGPNAINNYGSLTLSNGLTFGTSDSSAGTFSLSQHSGVMTLGGPIKNTHASSTVNVDFAGGTVNVTGNASFDVSSAQVSGPVTFNVAAGKTLNMTSLEIVGGGVLTKTGTGYLAFPTLAQAVTVSEGGVALDSGTYDLSAVTFAANTTVRIATFGGTINQGGYPASLTDNATFTADLSSASSGTTIFNSDDAALLGKIKADLATSVPQGLELTVSGTQLMLETATSDADTFTITGNITEGTGWGGSVPGAGANVAISGEGVVGTLPGGASFPAWASIEVKNGATLRIETDATLPPITLNKNATLQIGNNAAVTLANVGDLSGVVNVLGDVITIPVLSIESGATLNVPGGMKFANVDISLAGTLATSGDGGVTFGYAASGETTYIGLSVNGGIISLKDPPSGSYDASPLEFCCPAAGGSVVAIETLSFVNATIKPWARTSYPFTEAYQYGFHMGVNNPEANTFTALFDNTSWGVSGKTIITGGAIFRLQNGGKYQNPENLSLYGRTAELSKSAKIVIGSGSMFRLNAMGDYGNQPLYVNPTVAEYQSIVVEEGGTFESYRTAGNSKGVFTVLGDSDYCIFMPSNYHVGSSSTYNTTNAPFAGLSSVDISNGKTLSLTTRNKLWSDGKFGDDSGDRVVALANVPITGGGSVALSNDNVNVFGVIVTCGSNTATGNARVVAPAEGKGETTLYFADGANWAGTVTAGNVALTNLVNGAAASTNAFGTLDLAAERTFPVRVWKSGGAVVAHDGLNVDNYATNGGKIAFDVRGEAMALGEGFILGTIGAESPLPALARPWVAKRRDGGLLHVSISSGFSIIVR